MIAVLNFASNITPIINYHETKVLENSARLIYDNTLAINVNDSIATFNNVVDKNTKVSKNKFGHFVLSLPKEESISSTLFNQIANDYLDKMGYSNCPIRIYQHADKSHDHLHLVVSTIDYEGNKIAERGNFQRSHKAVIELENKFGLQSKIELDKSVVKLAELNALKFSVSNALKKLSDPDNKHLKYIQSNKLLNQSSIASLSNLTNKDIESKVGKDNYYKLYGYLDKEELIFHTHKELLQRQLYTLTKDSPSEAEYLKRCELNNIYVRKLIDKNKSPYFKYGITVDDKVIYFNETSLNNKLHYQNLFNKNLNKALFTPAQQANYIKYNLSKSLRTATSFTHLAEELKKAGINLNTNTRNGKVTGLSFIQSDIPNAEIIKLSSIDRNLKIDTIEKQFEKNKKQSEEDVTKSKTPIEKDTSLTKSLLADNPNYGAVENEIELQNDLRKRRKKRKM